MRISDWSSDVCSSDLSSGALLDYRERGRERIAQGKMGTNRRPARRRCSIAYWAARSVTAWVRVPSVHRYSPPTARPRPGCQLSPGQSRCGHAYQQPEAATVDRKNDVLGKRVAG